MKNNIYLCKPQGTVLSALSVDEESVSLTESVGDLWELSFDMHRYLYDDDRRENPYYDSVSEMMELYLDTDNCKARFLIDSEPTVVADGVNEIKTVSAHSIEAELQYKFLENFQINTGQDVSQENLLKGNLLREPVSITDGTQQLYDYNINPYTNLPIDYITVDCKLADDLREFRDNMTSTSIKWKFDGDDAETEITFEFDSSTGELIGDSTLLLKWYDEFTNKFPRIITDITWGYDKRENTEGVRYDTYGTVISVIDTYIATKTELDGITRLYVPAANYMYILNEDGTAYNIFNATDQSYSFTRFISGIESLISFYNKFGTQLSLLGLVLNVAKATDWTVGSVPDSVARKKYSFTVDGQDIYSFFVNNLSHTMKVIFDFDRVKKQISVLDLSLDDKEYETGIVTGFQNLLQSVNIQSSSADGIKTTFKPYGADDLGIIYVNFGVDKITNLDYFINKIDRNDEYQYGTAELHDKYHAWKRYRDEDLVDTSIPSYKFNLNTKDFQEVGAVTFSGTRRETYIELSKTYNRLLKDINELTYLVPSDGAMTDYTTFPLKDLQTVMRAYINAYEALIELYKAEFGKSEVKEDEIIKTYFYQDYKLYKDTIIPNVSNAMKMYALTNADGDFLDANGNITALLDEFVYPEGGNPAYNGNSELVTKNKSEAYLYDLSLYGLTELNVKRKAWAATAAQLYKEDFVSSGTPGEDAVYRTWSDIITDGLDSHFVSQEAYERQLNNYLDYMSISERENSLTKATTKGVVCMAVDAIKDCENTIQEMTAMQETINAKRSEIANGVTYEGWGQFTDKELTILYFLSHEADYTNENILTTNLDDIVTTIDVEKELLEDAQKRLFEKSRPQYSFSTTLDNILSVNGFEPLRSHVKLLNYFYLKYGLFDDETLKLRIVKITFNPFIENEELSLEFSNMTYTYDGINDYYYLYENMNGDSSNDSGSSGGSSGGGTYGENDAEITLSNNMLNALLKNESTSNSFNLNNMLTTKQIENLIVGGDLRVDGAAITNLIKSKNYNGSDTEIIDNTQGSVLDLKDGTFNFGGGALTFNGSKLTVSGKIEADEGRIAHFNINDEALLFGKKAYQGETIYDYTYPLKVFCANVFTHTASEAGSLNEIISPISYNAADGIFTITVTMPKNDLSDYTMTLSTTIYDSATGALVASVTKTVSDSELIETPDGLNKYFISRGVVDKIEVSYVVSEDGIYVGEKGLCIGKDDAFKVSQTGDTEITGQFIVNSLDDANLIYLGNNINDRFVKITPKSILVGDRASNKCVRIAPTGTTTGSYTEMYIRDILENDGVNSSGTSNWLSKFNYGVNTDTHKITWLQIKNEYKSVITSSKLYQYAYINNVLYDVSVANLNGLFNECVNLENIDFSDFISTGCTNMNGMFWGCKKLKSLDLSNISTKNVTSMSYMFYQCMNLTKLDLSHFDTSKVTTMDSMFRQCDHLQELNLSSFNTANVTNMCDMFEWCGYSATQSFVLDVTSFRFNKVTTMEDMFRDCGAQTVLFPTINAPLLTNVQMMFAYCKLLAIDLSGFTASSLTDASKMFYGCSETINIIIDHINISPVKTEEMFAGCDNLQYISGLQNLNMSNVTSMMSMFGYCSQLQSVNVSTWNTSKVSDMSGVFNQCSSLTVLDLSSWNTNKVTDIRYIFNGCVNLKTIYAEDIWDIQQRASDFTWQQQLDMFQDCNVLEGISPTTYYISKCNGAGTGADAGYAGYDGVGYLTNRTKTKPILDYLEALGKDENGNSPWINDYELTDVPGEHTVQPYVKVVCPKQDATHVSLYNYTWYHNRIFEINLQTLYVYSNENLISIDLSHFDTGIVYPSGNTCNFQGLYGWFEYDKNLQYVTFGNFLKSSTYHITDFDQVFYMCESLVNVDFENMDTTYADTMEYMFCDCESLVEADLSSFVFDNVTSVKGMFVGCESLQTVKFGTINAPKLTNVEYWFSSHSLQNVYFTSMNLPILTSMESMCDSAYNLVAFDLTKVFAPLVTNITWIFGECKAIKAIDFSNFQNNAINQMSHAFFDCESVEEINLSGCNWTLGDADYTISQAFFGCPMLRSLDLSALDVSNAHDFYRLFEGDTNLQSLNVSTWHISNVDSLDSMFKDCKSLTELDLSNFDTSTVSEADEMFSNCQSLVTIYVGDDWNMDRAYGWNMFINCFSIVGQSGFAYSDYYTDASMANYQTGYLTYKE